MRTGHLFKYRFLSIIVRKKRNLIGQLSIFTFQGNVKTTTLHVVYYSEHYLWT